MVKRKNNRLKDFNYSQNGAYFITVCTENKKCILSSIVGRGDPDTPQIVLSETGNIVKENIAKMNSIYSDVKINKYIIMPNHIHLIITVQCDNNGALGSPRPTNSNNLISNHIRALKRFTNKQANTNIWQTSFYDHIIRNEEDYCFHLQYIEENPKKWFMGKDEYYA